MRRFAFPLVVVVVLLALVFLWRLSLAPTRHEVAPSVVAPIANPVTSQRSMELAPVDDAAAPPIEDATRAAVDARTSATSGATFEVEVVQRTTLAPVPNAVVLALPASRVKQRLSRAPLESAWDSAEKEQDSALARYVCDANGRARLPSSSESLQLRARTDGFEGQMFVLPDERGRVRVEVGRRVEFVVRVVDSARRPVEGVPVALVACDRARVESHLSTHGRSNPEGLARLAYVDSENRIPGESSAVRLATLSHTRPLVAVDPEHPPAEPIELVLPPCGSIRAHAARAGGEPLGAPCTGWTAAPADAETPKSGIALPDERGDDWALFRFVETGLDVRVNATAAAFEMAQARTRGPALAGDEVDVRVEFTTARPIVRGVLTEASAAPIADTDFDVQLHTRLPNGMSGGGLRARTDASGAFEFPLPPIQANATGIALEIRTSGPAPRIGAVAHADLVLPLAAANDVGTLVAELEPVILEGIVVDEKGLGVSGASLMLALEPADPRAKQDAAAMKMSSRFVRTDGAGLFVARGAEWKGTVNVDVSRAPLARGSGLRFDVGSRDVRIVLLRAGSIAGRLLLPDRLDPAVVRVSCEPVEKRPEVTKGGGMGHVTGSDGTFRVDELTPGRYDVSVQWDASVPLVTSEDVVVVAGETTTVAPIDLRNALHVLELTVNAPDGKPLAIGTCAYTDGTSEALLRLGVKGGFVQLFPRALPCAVVVGAAGMRTQRFASVSEDLVVQLEKGPSARLVLAPSFVVPGDVDLRASVVLVPGKETLSLYKPGQVEARAEWRSRPIARGVDVALELTDPGEHRVFWSVVAQDGSKREVRFDPASSQTIEVRDMSEEQRFVVAPRAEDLTKALEELRLPR